MRSNARLVVAMCAVLAASAAWATESAAAPTARRSARRKSVCSWLAPAIALLELSLRYEARIVSLCPMKYIASRQLRTTVQGNRTSKILDKSAPGIAVLGSPSRSTSPAGTESYPARSHFSKRSAPRDRSLRRRGTSGCRIGGVAARGGTQRCASRACRERHAGGRATVTPVGGRIIEHYRAIEDLARSSASEEFHAIGKLVRLDRKAGA